MTNKTAVVNSKSFGVSFPEHLERLEKLGGVDVLSIPTEISQFDLAKQLEQYEYIIASVTPDFQREFFENSPNLKLIARHGLGYNSVDVVAAEEHGVYVTKVDGIVEQEAVAELAVSLIMGLVRHTPQADHSLRTSPWGNRSKYVGIEVKGSTVGVIGFGNIGSRVGEILKGGFGVELLVYDPNKDAEYIESFGGKKVSLEELLTKTDIISINASANDDNYHMLDADQFNQMKNGVLIVNTARGNLIEENALAAALKSGKVGGYGADVFEVEPILDSNPLLECPTAVLTPHIGAYTYPSLKGMGNKCIHDIELVIEGKLPLEIVNPNVKGVNG